MIAIIELLIIAILSLMLLKAFRTIHELKAKRKGYITFGGDDKYQNKNFAENIHDAAMIARIKLDMTDEEFEQAKATIKEKYLVWYHRLHNSINKSHILTGFCSPIEEWDSYQDYKPKEKQLLTKIIFIQDEKMILLVGNHVFLGGYLLSHFVQLVFCHQTSNRIFPKNKYFPIASELLILYFFTSLLLAKKHQPVDILDNKRDIYRLHYKTSTSALRAESDNIRIAEIFLVIAKHVMQVMAGLDRDFIRVSLPASFEDQSSFNTIGTMFIDVYRKPNLASMALHIRALVKRKRYQISATNHIQRIFPTRHLSTKARNRVDLTLTVVPEKTLPNNLLGEKMLNYEFTMDYIEYPVYIMAFIFEGKLESSFMINTKSFNDQALNDNFGQLREIDMCLSK